MGASFYAALTCGKTRLISHIHNNAFDSRGISMKAVVYLLAAKKAKHIFWVSASACAGYRFRKQVEKKSSVLYNIINVDSLYHRMEQDENTYPYDAVFLGRLTYPKNPQRMIRVFAEVVKQKPDVQVAIVGQGDLGDETMALAEELGVTENVHFLGFQSNPLKILHDAKVMLMTSRWEGLPMCVLESLALGTPIVSTPTDGVKERVEEGKNGFLSDEDEILADKILQIISDTQLCQQMSAYAKQASLEINDTQAYRAQLVQAYGGKIITNN
jgi:glycosyltransferase involved in cell wall biosynthesis